MTEDQLEQETLGWLTEVGYTSLFGPDISPDGSDQERDDYRQVLLFERLRNAIARLNVDTLVKSAVFARFFAGGLAGEFPVAVLSPADRAALGAESNVVLLSQESLAGHVAKHPEITLEDYRKIQAILDKGEVYKQGDARLIYITIDGVTYRAALKRTADGRKNYFLTLFKNETGARPKPDTRIR